MNQQTTPSPITSGEALKKLTDEQYYEILQPVLPPYYMQRYLNGDQITMHPIVCRAIIDRALAITEATITPSGEKDAFFAFFAEHGAEFANYQAAQLAFTAGFRAALAQRASAPDEVEVMRVELDMYRTIYGTKVPEWFVEGASSAPDVHPDDIAVDLFAVAMKAKMAMQRAKGYSGWDNPEHCNASYLRRLLVEHIAKGDPVDVGNFAMMLFNLDESTASSAPAVATGQPTPGAGSGVATGGADDSVTMGQAVLLAGVQALCIGASQEYTRNRGVLTEWDKGWYMGQLHIFDMYTTVEKSAIAEARAYVGKLAAPTAEEATGATFNQAELDALVEKGTKAWAGTPDDWLEELRGEPTLEQRHAHGVAMLMASAPAAGGAKQAAAVPDGWHPITAPGQVKVGTKLRFTIGDDRYSKTAKLILHAGTDQEEIIYNKSRNFYLITSMAMANKGGQKNVEFLRAAATTDGEGES